jgi:phospholipid/cholesterol/gamma-HCH transport system substrate-binding protein
MRRLAPIGLAAAVAGIIAVVVTNGTPRYTVTAEFGDVRGLVTGAQVRLAGVPVGDVERVWLGPDGWPRAELSIDRSVRLHADAGAAVRLASLSGEWGRYVSIVQGDGPPLASGAMIPRSRTTSPVEVDAALGTFDPATRAALRQMLSGLRASLNGRGPALAATLRSSNAALTEIGGMANDVDADGSSLQLALRSGHEIVGTLAGRSQALGGALDATTRLLNTLAEKSGSLAGGLAALPGGLAAAQQTLSRGDALIAPATRLLDAAEPAAAQLPPTSRELESALHGARPVLARAASIAARLPPTARRLMPVLAAARPLLGTMVPVLRRIGPMLDQLRVRLPDAFSFFANWADFTANYDANGHGARVGIVLPPTPTNVLSPSSNGPGQLAPPYLRTPGSLEGQPWTDYWKSFVAGGTRGPDVSEHR